MPIIFDKNSRDRSTDNYIRNLKKNRPTKDTNIFFNTTISLLLAVTLATFEAISLYNKCGVTEEKLQTVSKELMQTKTKLAMYEKQSKSQKVNQQAPMPPVQQVKPEPVPDNGTLAFKNRNPLNVKAETDHYWQGQIGRDKQKHAIFKSWEYGIRAASLTLRSYAKKHRINTVEGIIARFTDTKNPKVISAYINTVCKRLSLKPNEEFDIVPRIPELLRAMAYFEAKLEIPERYFAPYDILAKR